MMPLEASPWSNNWPPLAASGLAGPAAPSAAKLGVEKAEAPSNSPLATNIRDSTRFMKTSTITSIKAQKGAHACPAHPGKPYRTSFAQSACQVAAGT
ncbi:hypothetical protein D3C77_648270 [compost metagenome]